MHNIIFRGTSLPLSQLKSSINKINITIKKDLLCPNSISCKKIIKSLSLLSDKIKNTNEDIANYISEKNLTTKIKEEIKFYPKEIINTDFENNLFKSYLPLGVIGHVSYINDTYNSFTSIINSLLCGNINIILLANENSRQIVNLIKKLLEIDDSLQSYIYVFPLESLDKENLISLLNICNSIDIIGSESNKTDNINIVPNNVKINYFERNYFFTYITKSSLSDTVYTSIINEYMNYNSLNTNIIYYECDTKKDLLYFSENLMQEINKHSEYGEIENSSKILESIPEIDVNKKNKTILTSNNNIYRIIVDTDSEFNFSHNQTDIVIKGIKRKNIINTFIQYTPFINSVNLECDIDELYELTNLLSSAGINSISNSNSKSKPTTTNLLKYLREFSIQMDSIPKGTFNFEELNINNSLDFSKLPIAPKEVVNCISSSKEYIEENRINRGYSLLSSGLIPDKDICINILPDTNSFNDYILNYEILKKLNANQIVINENSDTYFVASEIINCNGNVLIGSSKYILNLFKNNRAALLTYGKVNKIFFNGDNFSLEELKYLHNDFNISLIKRFNYGSDKYGTLGISCEKCSNNIYHVNLPYKNLEILKINYDEPVVGNEIGRLVWNIKTPNGEEIIKYESGELGHFIINPCECGRNTPLFKVVGEKGDLFNLCQKNINYNDIKDILSEKLSYNGLIQINLENIDSWTSMSILVQKHLNIHDCYKVLYENSPAIKYILDNKLATITIINMDESEFLYNNEKIVKVIDVRN